MTTLTTQIHASPAPPSTPSTCASNGPVARLFAACRLEDGGRWALIGALVGLAILTLLLLA